MKKTLVALTVASVAVIAHAAPEANSIYVGAKAGWSSFHDGINQFDSKKVGHNVGLGVNRNSVTYGAFFGYQVLDNLAAEIGYDYFGRLRGLEKNGSKNKETFKHTAHGTTIALKGNYEVINGLDTYVKAGVALVNNQYKMVNVATKVRTSASRFQSSLLLGAGAEYAITPVLAARVEYQWLNNVGKASQAVLNHLGAQDYRPDLSSVSAGITYRFGQGAPAVIAPEVVNKTFSFSSDVLFDFGKSNLKPVATEALDNAYGEIQKLNLANPSVQVNGYTDRIGKDAPNLALSQRRAETVANYMVAKGVNAENITVVGYGKANPVTGNTCDAVKGRQALIACLAPDRRVELQVQGSKTVER